MTIDQTLIFCNNMDWTGAPNTPVLSGNSSNEIQIFGSLTLIADMVNNFNGNFLMMGTTTGLTFTSAGQTFETNVVFAGIGGEWTLQDDLSFNGADLRHQAGTLITQDFNISVEDGDLRLSGQAADLGQSTLSLCSGFMNVSSSINLSILNAIIEFDCGTGDLDGGNQTYNNITFNQGGTVYDANINGLLLFKERGEFNGDDRQVNAIIFEQQGDIRGSDNVFQQIDFHQDGELMGSNSYHNLSFTEGFEYQLEDDETHTITNQLVANGSCGDLITIRARTNGNQATLFKASGSVSLDFVSLQDIEATGGATFTATNSLDLGNNLGWTISSPPARGTLLGWRQRQLE